MSDDMKILLAKPRIRKVLENGDVAVYCHIIVGLTEWTTNRKNRHDALAAVDLGNVIVDLMALRELIREGAK